MTTEDETHATLRRYADAWLAADVAALFDSYADDVVFHYFGTTDLAGTHVGKEASTTAMVTASSRAERELVEVVDVTAGPVLGSIVVRERLSRDGVAAELQRVLLYRVAAGHIVECWLYDEDQPLVDRFWRA